MKKIAISLLFIIMLIMSVTLVSCVGDDKEYDDYEDFQTNSTEKETAAPAPETSADGVLGVGEDTDEGWGPIQRN